MQRRETHRRELQRKTSLVQAQKLPAADCNPAAARAACRVTAALPRRIFTGRFSCGGRIRYTAHNRMNKQAVYAYLAGRRIPYEAAEHEAVFSMAELPSVPLLYPGANAKNLFVRDAKKERYFLITVKGDKRVDLKAFRRRYGTRALSFACADELRALLGLEPGSVTPLGVLNDTERRVHVFLDAAFLEPPARIGVHPNDNTATVWLCTNDLIALIEEHGNALTIAAL